MTNPEENPENPAIPPKSAVARRKIKAYKSIFDRSSKPIDDLKDLKFEKIYAGSEIDEFICRIFSAPKTLNESAPDRIPVAWRILRDLARLRGALTRPDETLEEVALRVEDPMCIPFSAFADPKNRGIRSLVYKASTPLLPPEIPESEYGTDGDLDGSYAPENDALLENYCQQVYLVARKLRIHRTEKGKEGLVGLMDPGLARQAWPSADRLIEFEAFLVRSCCDLLMEEGAVRAGEHLRTTFDLTVNEIKEVILMSRKAAVSLSGLEDPRSSAAIQLLQMEKSVMHLEETHQHRAAIMGRRDIARLTMAVSAGDGSVDDEVEEDIKIIEATVADRKIPKLIPKKAEDL